jgi:hypothetical protein
MRDGQCGIGEPKAPQIRKLKMSYTRRFPQTQDFAPSCRPTRTGRGQRSALSPQRRRVWPTGFARHTAIHDVLLNAYHSGTRPQSPDPDHPRRPLPSRHRAAVCHRDVGSGFGNLLSRSPAYLPRPPVRQRPLVVKRDPLPRSSLLTEFVLPVHTRARRPGRLTR